MIVLLLASRTAPSRWLAIRELRLGRWNEQAARPGDPARPAVRRAWDAGHGPDYVLTGNLATAPVCLTVYIAWRFITWSR